MILVYTGSGKGKTTAALGAAFRALGHGQRVLMVQFFKGEWPVVFGELESAKQHPGLEIVQMGAGFVGIMGDKKPIEVHREAARQALDLAAGKIRTGGYDLVILDELNVAVELDLIPLKEVFQLLDQKPAKTHLLITGRNARPELVERADLVTEMKEIKHPFQKGMSAQKGIDF